ncbi:unnamed protein product, partial [Closterium sp. NIES-54]
TTSLPPHFPNTSRPTPHPPFLIPPNTIVLQEMVDEALDILFFCTPLNDFTMWPKPGRINQVLLLVLGLTAMEEQYVIKMVLRCDTDRRRYLRDRLQKFWNDALTKGRDWMYDNYSQFVPRPKLGGEKEGTTTVTKFLEDFGASEFPSEV